jgi:pyoverdine/dityrosine biosynthesis protein Dit1
MSPQRSANGAGEFPLTGVTRNPPLLSIHPQAVGAPKFGIRLLDAPDAWATPWHSAALRRPDGTWSLMPRVRAEQLGRLVRHEGRASHFV